MIAEYLDIPLGLEAGGVRTYMLDLTSEFKRQGHSVQIFDGQYGPRVFANRHLVRLMPNFDLNHIQEPTLILASSTIPSIRKAKNLAVTFHAPVSNPTLARIYNSLARLLYSKTSAVITSTERNREYLRKMGIKGEVHVIPMWAGKMFEPAGHDAARKRFVLSVCAIDNYHTYKNYPCLSRVARILRQELNVELVHAGPRTFDLPHVTHLGPVSKERLLQLYQDALMFVLPSLSPFEGFGITAAEALACGTPVLVSDGCGISEYLDSCFVSPVNQFVEKIRNTIPDVINNPDYWFRKSLEAANRFSFRNCTATTKLLTSLA